MYNSLLWLYSEVTIPGDSTGIREKELGLTAWELLRMRGTRDQMKPEREVTLKVIQRVMES